MRRLLLVIGAVMLVAFGAGSGEAASLRQHDTGPPTNLVAPSLSGTIQVATLGGGPSPVAAVGNTLTVTQGTWTGTPTLTYIWMRCDSNYANCSQIGGATSASYTVSAADLGSTVVGVVYASTESGTQYAYADLRGVVGTPYPSSSASPVSLDWYPGPQPTPTVGQTLTPENDSSWWLGAQPITFSYQWARCDSLQTNCSSIAGATSLSYTVSSADVGHILEIAIHGSNQYGSSGFGIGFDTGRVTAAPTVRSETASIHHAVHTFANYHNASGQGPDIAASQTVQVSCKVLDGTIQSVNPDGYWYRVASSPWDDHFYAPANTFLNGDPPNGPYSHNTDFAVPDCSGAVSAQVTPPPPIPGGGIVKRVVNADGGVYWRGASPNWNNPIIRNGYGVYNGDQVELECWTRGSTVPPYWNNSLWYQATIVDGRGKGEGFVNDHFIDTGINVPNRVVQGVPNCATSSATDSANLSQYVNRIVQWSGDSKGQKTSWLVGSDLKRRWIPDISTYNCLLAHGAKPWPSPLPSATLSQLTDLTGTWATCGAAYVTPCVFSIRWKTDTLTFSYSGNHRYYGNAWQAAKEWTDLGTGITITPAPSGQTGDIIFDDINATPVTYAAHTNYPPNWADRIYATVPRTIAHTPSAVHILVNQAHMESLDDAHRTFALAHELGHALGLAHSDQCGITAPSVMHSGGSDIGTRTVVTPQYYDKIDLEELYNLPRG